MKYKDILGYSEPEKKLIKEKVEKPTITEQLTEEFGGLLLEKKELDSKIIQKISKMTDRNDHTGARTHLSYYLEGGNRGKLFKYFDASSQMRDIFGHVPSELSKLNQKMERELYRQLYRKYSNAKEIIGAL